MQPDINVMFAKINSLEKEFIVLRKGYLSVNKKYISALSGLSSLTLNAAEAAKRAAKATKRTK